MTKSEFIKKKMDEVLMSINDGCFSCNAIRALVSSDANKRYKKEFRLLNSGEYWIDDFVYRFNKTSTYSTDCICLRQVLWQWFLDWSIENKYYKGY